MPNYSLTSIPGSSGLWSDFGSSQQPGVTRLNMGQPGDRYRAALGAPTLDPTMARKAQPQARWDAFKGLFVDPTGNPFTGSLPDGTPVAGGIRQPKGTVPGDMVRVPGSTEMINPNDTTQRYKAVEEIKDQPVATAADALLAQFKKGAADSFKGFDDYKNEFAQASKNALTKSNQATDIAPIEARMRDNQAQYNTALDTSSADYAAQNRDFANRTRGFEREATDNLGLYDAVQNRIEQAVTNAVGADTSRYSGAKNANAGVGLGLGSDIPAYQARELTNALLPLELAKVNRRNDVVSQRYGMEGDLASREVNRISQFNPMVAGQRYQTSNATESQIQGLRERTATMSFENAQRYLQSLGVPQQLWSQILGTEITQLGAIGQLRDQSRYRGLQDRLGATLPQQQYFDQRTPGYPSPSRYAPTGAAPITTLGTGNPNAANPVDPRMRINPITGRPQWADDQIKVQSTPQRPALNTNRRYGPTQNAGNSYDPTTGMIVDVNGNPLYDPNGSRLPSDLPSSPLYNPWGDPEISGDNYY